MSNGARRRSDRTGVQDARGSGRVETTSEFSYRAIGFVRSPNTEPSKTPIQPTYAKDIEGRVEVLPEFAEGLRDIEGFSHIYLIFALDRAGESKLTVTPYLSDEPRGVFATRAPSRPNAIGMSLVRLLRRDGNVLHISGVDILDGTPVLDIKPYSSWLDSRLDATSGWLDDVDGETAGRRGRRGYDGGSERGQDAGASEPGGTECEGE